MRAQFARGVSAEAKPELLTTGEVARLLGTSRQHVVDLCNAGVLPFTLIGRHRRISRPDVQAYVSGTRTLTRDQLKSWWLAFAVAAELVRDPESVLGAARANLARMQQSSIRGAGQVWLAEWEALMNGPVDELLDALTARSPRSRELRQNSPFAGVLEDRDRVAVLASFARFHSGSKS